MNMGRPPPPPPPPLLPVLQPELSSAAAATVGATPTELCQSETARSIDNLVTSSPLFYRTGFGAGPTISSTSHEQLGSPSILKPNFRDLTGCTRLTTSLSQSSKRALPNLVQSNRGLTDMGKSSHQTGYSGSRTRSRERLEREKVLTPIRVNAKIRQIYSQVAPSPIIPPPPPTTSRTTQTETEHFLSASISAKTKDESQIRQAEIVASKSNCSKSGNYEFNTADACTSPINTPSSRKSSALPPLSFTPNYISKLEDLEKITGHIIIQRFFTRTDDVFGTWIEKQLSLTQKTVGVDTAEFEDVQVYENVDPIGNNNGNVAEIVEESEKQEETPGQPCVSEIVEIAEDPNENVIEREIRDKHEGHDPLECALDDCVHCECFRSEFGDETVIDPRSSTPINDLSAIEEEIISQCVVLELKRALEKDANETEPFCNEDPETEKAESTTLESEIESTFEKQIEDEIVAPLLEVTVLVHSSAEGEAANEVENEDTGTTQEVQVDNSEADAPEQKNGLEDIKEADEEASGESTQEVVRTLHILENIPESTSEDQVDGDMDTNIITEAQDALPEAEISKTKVVDYLAELGELPTSANCCEDTTIYSFSGGADDVIEAESSRSQIIAEGKLTDVLEEEGECIEQESESVVVPILKRSTSIDSCLGTESSGETRNILNDSGSSRLGDSARFENEIVCWPSISDMVPNAPTIKSLDEIIQEHCPEAILNMNMTSVTSHSKSWDEQESQEQEITVIRCIKSANKANPTAKGDNVSLSSPDEPPTRRESESDRRTEETESDVNSENYHARSEAESSLLQDDVEEEDVDDDDQVHSQEDRFESIISSHVKGKFVRGVKRNISTQTGKSIDSSRTTTASTNSSFDLEVVSKSKRFTTTQLSSGNSDYAVTTDRRRSYLPSGSTSLNLLNMKFSVGNDFQSEVSICVPANKGHGGESSTRSFAARRIEKSYQQPSGSKENTAATISRQQTQKTSHSELTTLWKDVKVKMDSKVGLGRSESGNRFYAEPELEVIGSGMKITESLGALTVTNSATRNSSGDGSNEKIKRSLQRLKKILDN